MAAETISCAGKDVHKWLEREKLMWKHRSRVEWGDKNKKCFHAKASARRKKNCIKKLQTEIGLWAEGENMETLIVDYFKNLCSASNQLGSMEFLSGLQIRISEKMNEELSKRFIIDEVYKAYHRCILSKLQVLME